MVSGDDGTMGVSDDGDEGPVPGASSCRLTGLGREFSASQNSSSEDESSSGTARFDMPPRARACVCVCRRGECTQER